MHSLQLYKRFVSAQQFLITRFLSPMDTELQLTNGIPILQVLQALEQQLEPIALLIRLQLLIQPAITFIMQ